MHGFISRTIIIIVIPLSTRQCLAVVVIIVEGGEYIVIISFQRGTVFVYGIIVLYRKGEKYGKLFNKIFVEAALILEISLQVD